MSDLHYTLVSDGTSGPALIPILTWLLLTNGVKLPVQPVSLLGSQYVERQAFLKLPIEERRRIMAKQAREMAAHYDAP